MVAKIDEATSEAETVLAMLTRPAPAMGYRDKPRLREEIRSLMRAIDSPVNAPTEPQIVRLAQLHDERDAARDAYETLVADSIAQLNEMAADMPQVLVGSAGD